MDTNTTLAELAATQAGAVQVFHRHHLDFCCGGQKSLKAACEARQLEPAAVLAEIQAATPPPDPLTQWSEAPLDQVLAHVLERYHAGHREVLPHLLQMSEKVEAVHADHPERPTGLTGFLVEVADELEGHMQKEEQILFPMILEGQGYLAGPPIRVMTQEHDEHGVRLARLRALAHDYQPPPDACTTWRALYAGLAELEHELMAHIHLENNVLFKRARQ
jgi:regulator of cell morphogenesis and NO signaling